MNSGKITLRKRDILDQDRGHGTLEQLAMWAAKAKGCPIDGVLAPKLHPDYCYLVTRHACDGSTDIEWKPL